MNVKTKNLIQLRARQADEAMVVIKRNSIQQMSKDYGRSPAVISRTASGTTDTLSPEVTAEIKARSEERRAAEKVYARHCRTALNKQFGKAEVNRALGIVPSGSKMKKPEASPVLAFLSMRLTSAPLHSVTYY
jgi:hypothetical protein